MCSYNCMWLATFIAIYCNLRAHYIAKYNFIMYKQLSSYTCYLGSIEISIATMSKKERAKNEEVYVCGFVPSHLLPKKRPNSLDPFIHPLVEEVEDLFINGIT